MGFDATDDLTEGLKNGYIDALIAQDPFTMGYRGVKLISNVLREKEVPERVMTRSVIVTPENVDKDKIQEIVDPPVSKYLD